ncbi:ketopantoate reductase family protein [Cohnella suwonensis]|uniref:2-dehydropantoate 2-reductase n=1 Tax=Cohnella suwonensis TaxID=696072 RepID=A0ABW0LMN1_9BACL
MACAAVAGAGSMGLLLAAKLNASGIACELWTRTEEQAEALVRDGISLQDETGEELSRVAVRAMPLEEAATARSDGPKVVFLAVKQTALKPPLLALLARAVPTDGTIVALQNGFGHLEALKEALPETEVVPAVTTEGALRKSGTTVSHTGKGEFRVGLADESDRRSSDRVEAMLKQAGFTAFVSNEWEEALLRKLLANAVINPLTAIWGARNGQLLESERKKAVMKALFRETYGILRGRKEIGEEDELWRSVMRVCEKTAANRSSMLQDVLAGRETEIDYINGAVCRMAEEQGLPSPWNETLTALVKAIP